MNKTIPIIVLALDFVGTVFLLASNAGDKYLVIFLLNLFCIGIARATWPKSTTQEPAGTSKATIAGEAELQSEIDTTFTTNRPLPEPTTTPESGIQLPEKDNWETDYLIGTAGAIPVDILCFLHYRDNQGQESKRRVTINQLVPWNDEYALLAYCHERQAHRTFKISGIISLADIETGEIIENPVAYLTDRFKESPIGKYTALLQEIEPEVLALVFLGRVDGRLSKNEKQVIIEYIAARGQGKVDALVIDQEVRLLRCELTEFRKSLKDLASLPANIKQPFLEAAEKVVAADKKVDPLELAGLEKIKQILS